MSGKRRVRVRVSPRARRLPIRETACRFDSNSHARGRRERGIGGRTHRAAAGFYPEPLCRPETTILTRAAAEEPSSTDGGHRLPTRAENGQVWRKEGRNRHRRGTKAPFERGGPGSRRSRRTPAPDNGHKSSGQRKQFLLASEKQPSWADGESGLSRCFSMDEE